MRDATNRSELKSDDSFDSKKEFAAGPTKENARALLACKLAFWICMENENMFLFGMHKDRAVLGTRSISSSSVANHWVPFEQDPDVQGSKRVHTFE